MNRSASVTAITSATAHAGSYLQQRNSSAVKADHGHVGNDQHGYDSVLFDSAEAFQNHNDIGRALCVILDINLNDESGIEVRQRLKAAGISVPVIYITANDNHAVRMAALESGCIAYLTKPFSARSLIERLEQASAGLA